MGLLVGTGFGKMYGQPLSECQSLTAGMGTPWQKFTARLVQVCFQEMK